MIEELLKTWRLLQPISPVPPSEPLLLWRSNAGVICVNNRLAPPIPYPSYRHENGEKNHGYTRLKGNLDALKQIPELQGFPEFEEFVRKINAPDSAIESVGCEKGFFPFQDNPPITSYLGSYTDVVFSNPTMNENPENFLRLAAQFMKAAEGCEQWWGNIELGLQTRPPHRSVIEPWGLVIKVLGYGRDESEARKLWGVTLVKLAEAIPKVPSLE